MHIIKVAMVILLILFFDGFCILAAGYMISQSIKKVRINIKNNVMNNNNSIINNGKKNKLTSAKIKVS